MSKINNMDNQERYLRNKLKKFVEARKLKAYNKIYYIITHPVKYQKWDVPGDNDKEKLVSYETDGAEYDIKEYKKEIFRQINLIKGE